MLNLARKALRSALNSESLMTEQKLPNAGGSAVQLEPAKITDVPVETDGAKPIVQNSDSEESQAEPENQGAERKRGKGGFQRKIEKAEQERDFWREQALKSSKPEAKTERKEEAKTDNPPKLDDFDSYDEFIRADARYHAEKALDKKFSERDSKQREESLKAEREKQLITHRDRMKKFAEKNPDFETLVEESESPFNEAMRDACVESEMGPEIIKYLAENPEKAKAMIQMGVTALNREIGRIEASLEKAGTEQDQPTKATTKAPAPFKPVSSGKSADVGGYNPNWNQAQYEAWRKKGGGRKT